MVSLPEELRARVVAARRCVEELQAEAAELALRLEKAREDLPRLEITRETVAQVLAELSAAEVEPDVVAGDGPEPDEASAPHGTGVMMVPPWREGLVTEVLPDVYRDIVEVIADAPGPLQAKQIVPRIGLPATTGKQERVVAAGPRRSICLALSAVHSAAPIRSNASPRTAGWLAALIRKNPA
jgi:hypothetical protein